MGFKNWLMLSLQDFELAYSSAGEDRAPPVPIGVWIFSENRLGADSNGLRGGFLAKQCSVRAVQRG